MTDFIALSQQLTQLETKIDQQQETLMALADTLTQLQAEDTELAADVAALVAAHTAETAQIADLQAQIAALTASGGATAEQLTALQAVADDLANTHNTAVAALPAAVFSGQNVDAVTGFTWRIGGETFADSQARLFTFNEAAGASGTAQVAQPYPTETEWDALTAA